MIISKEHMMSRLTSRIIKIIFHTICLVIIFGTAVLLLWRIFIMGVPSSMKALTVNERIVSAYGENGGTLTLFYQDQNTVTRADNNYGYFAAPYVTFIREADQLQVVFRYNNSTLKHLANDYSLPSVPDRNGDYYDVTVSVSTDLTPDIEDDNLGNDPQSVKQERYMPTSVTSEQNSLYNYRKYVFDGISIDDGTLAVYLDIYYNEDVDYSKEAYGTLCLYDYKTPTESRKLTSGDKKNIESFEK